METNIEKEKKRRKQPLDEMVFNRVILALEAPVNANIESVLQTSQKNTEGGSSQKKKRKKKKHRTVETNIEKEKKRKQSLDVKVFNCVSLALKAPVDANIESALQTSEKNTEGCSSQKKKRKKKKHRTVENNSLAQKLTKVGNMGEQDLKELEDMEMKIEIDKKSKQSLDENLEVSNTVDLFLNAPDNGNTEMAVQLQTTENNIEGGSTQKKKRKKKKHKAAENNSPVQKLPKIGSLGEQDKKELDDMEIDIVKEKKRKKPVDENLEVSDTDYLSLKSPVNQRMETVLQTAENNTGGSSGRDKKRKEKKCKAVKYNGPVKKLLEDGNLCEKDARELEDVEINIEKDKKRRHILNENRDISNADDLSLKSLVNGNVKMALQTAEKSTGGSSSWKKKRKEKKCKSVENNSPAKQLLEGVNLCEQDGKELEDVEINMDKELKIKGSLDENKVISKVEDLAMKSPIRNIEMDMQRAENNSEGSSRQKNKRMTKKKCKVVENNEPVREILESGNMCDQDLKNIKHLEKLNHDVSMGSTLILEVVESDTDLKKNDKLAETSSINNGREQRRKRKKKKLSCSSASSTEPAYVMQTVQNSSVEEVSVSCSDNLVSSKRKLGKNRKNRANENELKEAQKSVGEHGISEETNLEELPNMLHGCSERKLEIDMLAGVKENEDELNKIQKAVQDHEFSGKQSVEEFLTYCDKDEYSLETGNDLDSAAHILINLRHGNYNSLESGKGGLNTQSQSVEKISIGESSANCVYKNPTPGKGVRKKKKVSHALLDSPCNAFPKKLEQKNEIKISSGNGSVMNDDISVGAISKEDNLLEKLPTLPERSPCSTPKKLLILDLNGLLADIVSDAPKGFKADKKIARKSLFKRKHCDEFLKFCFERFDVGVWSSRHKKNVDGVVDFLMKDMKHKLLFCWDQSHCTNTGFKTIENKHKPLVLKELKKLWDKHDPNLPWEKGDYNESNSLLVDDSPYKALCNPPNTAIFPDSYRFQDTEDNSLGTGGNLRVYLEGLSMAEDVQKYVKEHPFGQCAITCENPSWSFYSTILGAKISEVKP
ncbi:eukaryotic translation initiation factor 5B-like isoform X2 [Telopea speciosissima]|uniref:eukaryotic translation initiation factor 5B-like isoform X2 n=1 Tax=Telopea speciosissima TaxID=54955 RepID=UPI001CC49763|nr:eukaryotic translation initiation factor 5B-like isoform X2 [Telopea speciosissima]